MSLESTIEELAILGLYPAPASSLPANAVVIDAVTGLFETPAGGAIVDASVATMTDLILLTDDAIYGGTSIIVENPADNISNYFPAKAYRMNSRWYLENGEALLYAAAPRTRYTWPAAAWVPGTLSSGGVGLTVIDGGATLHALTAANQTTSLTTYVYISGSTGAGTVDWPIGPMQLSAIPTTNDLTVVYPYDANLRTPIITPIGAGVLSAVEVARIAIPPLSASGGYEVLLSVKNFIITTEHRCKIWACAAGTTLATLYGQTAPVTGLLNNVNDATAAPIGVRAGLQNAGATNVNTSVGAYVSTTGLGLGTGAVGYAVPALQTNVPTELVITFESSNGIDITMELVNLIVKWRY